MGVLADFQIEEQIKIVPFIKDQVSKGVVSYGVTSYGYDTRVGNKFRIFTNVNNSIIDPKALSPQAFVHFEGDVCIIPPNSFILAETVEYFEIPRDVLAICVGKSTYARCFTADTRVSLVDGSRPTFLELTSRWDSGERDFYGYGYSQRESRYVVQPLLSPRLVGEEETVVVELDNEEFIECTADHEFWMRDGSIKPAGSLEPEDSLLPLYLHDSHGYESIYNPLVRDWQPTHLAVEECLVRNNIWDTRLAEYHLHHDDFNKRNNHPRNLKRLSSSEHVGLHNSTKDLSAQSKAYWSDPANKAFHLSLLRTPESIRKASESKSRFYATEEGKKVSASARKRMWETRGQLGRESQADVARRINIRDDITQETVLAALQQAGTVRGAARLLNVDRSAFRRFPDIVSSFKKSSCNNHKVVAVNRVEGTKPVYCLTAPETGNFALSSGVVVSNCGLIVNVTPLEPQWRGKITIEISNTTPLPAKVYANEGIAQLVFFKADQPCKVSYEDRKGKYQDQPGLVLPFVK